MEVGELYKHFKGKDLIEKNIYEILQMNVVYTGTNGKAPIENLVIYRNLFQNGKIFAREYNELVEELSKEKQTEFGQVHRIEKLTEEEKKIVNSFEFMGKKLEYYKSKENER